MTNREELVKAVEDAAASWAAAAGETFNPLLLMGA